MSMQDFVGKFVDINIEYAGPESLAVGTVFYKDLSFDGQVWKMYCYPGGAPGDAGAGEYLSVHLVNKSNARNAKALFEAVVLGRADGGAAAPPSLYSTYICVVDYPEKDSMRCHLTRIFRTSELADHCVVGGYITLKCGIVVLRHSPIPVPPSSYANDIRGLEVRKRFGEPDVTFAVGGKLVGVNHKVLAARSPVFRAELDGPMVESSMPIIHPQHEFKASTFNAVLLYIYQDRLPRDEECEVSLTELLRDLLAAADWYALDRLKLMCANKLWEDMSVETISKTLWYADRYSCRELKNACMDFLAVAENMSRVSVTEEYLWLGQSSPSIVQELGARVWAKLN